MKVKLVVFLFFIILSEIHCVSKTKRSLWNKRKHKEFKTKYVLTLKVRSENTKGEEIIYPAALINQNTAVSHRIQDTDNVKVCNKRKCASPVKLISHKGFIFWTTDSLKNNVPKFFDGDITQAKCKLNLENDIVKFKYASRKTSKYKCTGKCKPSDVVLCDGKVAGLLTKAKRKNVFVFHNVFKILNLGGYTLDPKVGAVEINTATNTPENIHSKTITSEFDIQSQPMSKEEIIEQREHQVISDIYTSTENQDNEDEKDEDTSGNVDEDNDDENGDVTTEEVDDEEFDGPDEDENDEETEQAAENDETGKFTKETDENENEDSQQDDDGNDENYITTELEGDKDDENTENEYDRETAVEKYKEGQDGKEGMTTQEGGNYEEITDDEEENEMVGDSDKEDYSETITEGEENETAGQEDLEENIENPLDKKDYEDTEEQQDGETVEGKGNERKTTNAEKDEVSKIKPEQNDKKDARIGDLDSGKKKSDEEMQKVSVEQQSKISKNKNAGKSKINIPKLVRLLTSTTKKLIEKNMANIPNTNEKGMSKQKLNKELNRKNNAKERINKTIKNKQNTRKSEAIIKKPVSSTKKNIRSTSKKGISKGNAKGRMNKITEEKQNARKNKTSITKPGLSSKKNIPSPFRKGITENNARRRENTIAAVSAPISKANNNTKNLSSTLVTSPTHKNSKTNKTVVGNLTDTTKQQEHPETIEKMLRSFIGDEVVKFHKPLKHMTYRKRKRKHKTTTKLDEIAASSAKYQEDRMNELLQTFVQDKTTVAEEGNRSEYTITRRQKKKKEHTKMIDFITSSKYTEAPEETVEITKDDHTDKHKNEMTESKDRETNIPDFITSSEYTKASEETVEITKDDHTTEHKNEMTESKDQETKVSDFITSNEHTKASEETVEITKDDHTTEHKNEMTESKDRETKVSDFVTSNEHTKASEETVEITKDDHTTEHKNEMTESKDRETKVSDFVTSSEHAKAPEETVEITKDDNTDKHKNEMTESEDWETSIPDSITSTEHTKAPEEIVEITKDDHTDEHTNEITESENREANISDFITSSEYTKATEETIKITKDDHTDKHRNHMTDSKDPETNIPDFITSSEYTKAPEETVEITKDDHTDEHKNGMTESENRETNISDFITFSEYTKAPEETVEITKDDHTDENKNWMTESKDGETNASDFITSIEYTKVPEETVEITKDDHTDEHKNGMTESKKRETNQSKITNKEKIKSTKMAETRTTVNDNETQTSKMQEYEQVEESKQVEKKTEKQNTEDDNEQKLSAASEELRKKYFISLNVVNEKDEHIVYPAVMVNVSTALSLKVKGLKWATACVNGQCGLPLSASLSGNYMFWIIDSSDKNAPEVFAGDVTNATCTLNNSTDINKFTLVSNSTYTCSVICKPYDIVICDDKVAGLLGETDNNGTVFFHRIDNILNPDDEDEEEYEDSEDDDELPFITEEKKKDNKKDNLPKSVEVRRSVTTTPNLAQFALIVSLAVSLKSNIT